MGLNPALEDVRFCPRCGRPATVDYPRSLRCPTCGYGAYYNPKPVAAAILRDDGDDALWLLRRAWDPGRGRWTFPGGFVDLGESVPDAARRETREELGVDAELDGLVGVYSRPDERVVLVVYSGRACGLPTTSAEAAEVRRFAVDALPWDELAFWSTTAALRDFIAVDAPA